MASHAEMVARLEEFDNFAGLRNALRAVAEEREEWAGIPIPIDGETLVIEPSYQFAALGQKPTTQAPTMSDDGVKIRNIFWSHRHRCDVAICEYEGEFYSYPLIGSANQADKIISTIGCSFAWGVEQEGNAITLLGTLLRHVAFKQYLLTGMFLETSKRSGVTYVFRRLKPTVAIKEGLKGRMRILAALCMHPIGYYEGSWAGAMCPTDDVIAHLMLMRGDEVMFWRRCNQHPPQHPAAGL